MQGRSRERKGVTGGGRKDRRNCHVLYSCAILYCRDSQTAQYGKMRLDSVQGGAVRCNTIRYDTAPYGERR